MFPSPCGEKVGINGGALRTPRGYKVLFPSPCGEKVGINLDISAKVGAFPKSAVSVPLRGKGRDQRAHLSGTIKSAWPFPSPCGEKVGINIHD